MATIYLSHLRILVQVFLGYNLVVLPLGFSLNLALHDIDPLILFYAFEITLFIDALDDALGTCFLHFFKKFMVF